MPDQGLSASDHHTGSEDENVFAKYKLPRLWPVWLIVAGQMFALYLTTESQLGTFTRFVILMVAPLACLIAMAVWFLAASRLSWKERIVGWLMLVVPALVGMPLAAKDTEIAFWMYGVPLAVLLTSLTLTAIGNRTPNIRLAVTSSVVVVGWGILLLLRLEGMSGDYFPQFAFRWVPTVESQLSPVAGKADSDLAFEDLSVSAWQPQKTQWPHFRGPTRNSQVQGLPANMDWKQKPPVEKWRIPVGPAWSSMILVDDRLFTQEQRGEQELVSCYRANDGTVVWQSPCENRFSDSVAGAGPRATPCFFDGRIYALGAKAILSCLDASTGRLVWRRDLMKEVNAQIPVWGFSGSPVVVDGHVIVYAGGSAENGLMAFRVQDGSTAWTYASKGMNFSSVQSMNMFNQIFIVFSDASGAHALDPQDGDVLWEYLNSDGEQPPVVQCQQIAPSTCIAPIGDGYGMARVEIAKSDNGKWSSTTSWFSKQLKPSFNDYVLVGKQVIGFDNNLLTCIDVGTAERRWKKRGYDFGQLLASQETGQVIVTTERGEIALLDVRQEKMKDKGRIKVFDSKTWNHPMSDGKFIYHRNDREMVCLEL